ncbi:MAG: FG-GAP repeat protein, partial [Nanoarchaeota archaeon]|nr:FG-GAP repeat protein [Nanoarchaeota archaeon]
MGIDKGDIDMKKIILMFAIGIGFMVLFSTLVSADISEIAKIQASDKAANDQFGNSVSISSDGNTAIVGAHQETTGGAAYIFRWTGTVWSEQAKIQASDKEADDSFGKSVSISSDGNTTIVGASGESSYAGAAYIFRWNGANWTEQAKIQASDAEAMDFLGKSISISSDGNTAIVGASGEDIGGTDTGAAYIFRWTGTNWTQQTKIQASDKEAYDYFGISVSISSDGNTTIVGAYAKDTDGINTGAVYIFRWDGANWTQQSKIQASDKESEDHFGYSVSISSDGNSAIVGARYEDTGGSMAGAAYIFRWNGTAWSEQAKIQASDKEASDQFGQPVSISSDGNTAIVGASGEDTGGSYAGAAYIFEFDGTTWTEQAKIQASDNQASDWFGSSISISSDGNYAIVGANGEDTGASNAGAAYFFKKEITLPTYTNFTSTESTNFSDVTLSSVTSLTLAIENKGKIKFPVTHSINSENEDYDTNIVIEDKVIFVNSSALHSSFNSSATLTFENVDCNKPYVFYSETASTFAVILSENQRCPESLCSNILCADSTLTVDVEHFTGFAAGADANLTTEAEAGIFYPLDSIEFTAEYINSTDGT